MNNVNKVDALTRSELLRHLQYDHHMHALCSLLQIEAATDICMCLSLHALELAS